MRFGSGWRALLAIILVASVLTPSASLAASRPEAASRVEVTSGADPGPVPGSRTPDPVTFVPEAGDARRANRPEALLGFGSGKGTVGRNPRTTAPTGSGTPASTPAPTPDPVAGLTVEPTPAATPAPTREPASPPPGTRRPSVAGPHLDAAPAGAGPAAEAGPEATSVPAGYHVISGTIRNAAGAGVGGILLDVETIPWSGSALFGWSAADGTYAVAVPSGTWGVYLSNRDVPDYYGSWWCSAKVGCETTAPTPIAVTTADVTGIDYTLKAYPYVRGRVTNTAGTGLAGINVNPHAPGVFLGSAITAADGTYALRLVETGDLVLAFHDPAGNSVGGWFGPGGYVADSAAATHLIVGPDGLTGIDGVLPAYRFIRGTVSDVGGGIGGVWVDVSDATTAYASGPTAGDGTFAVKVPPGGSYVLGFRDFTYVHRDGWYASGGFTPDRAAATPVPVSSADVTGINVTMPLNPTIGGTVRNEGNSRLGGIRVRVSPYPGTSVGGDASATTAADGSWSVQLPPGTYIVQFWDTSATYVGGFRGPSGYVRHQGDADQVIVATTPVAGLDVKLPEYRFVSGRVTAASGASIPGIGVAVSNGPGSGTTAADGSYSLKVEPGSWTISFDPSADHRGGWYGSGGWVATQAEAVPVVVAGSDRTGIDVVLPFWPRISGTVLDTHGAPVAGMTVELWSGTSWRERWVTSAADGGFFVHVRGDREWRLVTAGLERFLATERVVTVADADVPGQDLVVAARPVIRGRITDPSGSPVVGVQVRATQVNGGYGQWTTATDDDGRYTLHPVVGATVTVSLIDPSGVHVPGYIGASGWVASTPQTIALDADEVREDAIVMPAYLHLTGHVRDEGGNPIEGGHVAAYTGADSLPYAADVVTGADGAFDLRLAPRDYLLKVTGATGFSPGWYGAQGFVYLPGATDWLALDTADAQAEIVLPPSLFVRGRVTSGSTPLAGIEVDLFLDGAAYGYTTTAADGTWAVPAAPGAYLVGVYDGTGRYAHGFVGAGGFTADPALGRLVTIAATDATDVNVSLPATRRVSGTVLDAWGLSHRNVLVESFVGGVYYGSAITGKGGVYSVPVAAGNVTLWVWDYEGSLAPGWRTATGLTANSALAAVTRVSSSNVTGVTIRPPAALFVTGLLTYSTTPGSVASWAGLYAEAVGYGAAQSFAWTDGYGNYVMPVLRGTYRLWIDDHDSAWVAPGTVGSGWYRTGGGVTPSYGAALAIAVTGPRRISVELGATSHLTGTVADRHGLPVGSVEVELFVDGYLYRSVTADYGTFIVPALPATYRVAFVDRYGLYKAGWLGPDGYVPDFAAARDVVVPAAASADVAMRMPLDAPPAAPSAVATTPYHGAALVTWTAPATTPDRPIIRYTATASPGGRACMASRTTRCLITGLADGTAYTVSVVATTIVGTGPASVASGPVTPKPVPDAVGGLTATPAGSTVTVAWEPPVDNGSPVTGYAVSAAPGGATCIPEPATASACSFAALPDGRYTFTVAAANANGGGLPATSAITTIDTTGPVIGAPVVSIRSGLSMSGSSVPVVVAWAATDPLSTIASTGLRLSVSGRTPLPQALGTATATTLARTLPAGSATYRFSATGTDARGNVAPWVSGPALTLAIRQENTSGMTWAGTWRSVASSSALGGRLRYTTGKGASLTYRFTGRGIALVARRGSTRGMATVYIDGIKVASVDLNGTSASRWIAYQRSFPTSGSHKIKIVCAGTTSHPRIDVDALVVLR